MKPSRCSLTISLMFVSLISVFAQEPELRGVWMTPRSGNGFWSKTQIAQAMDSVANNNFNVVYFNAWSRGWPLWRSSVFFAEAGFLTDPATGERDILQEAIAEAHRRGLELEAWMEYGFVGWWSGYNLPGYPKGSLFARHPDWLGRDSNGNDQFPIDLGVYYWMSHNHPAAQDFLIRLHREIAERYDVDGIELDRIRYPRLDCGYDSSSIAIYRSEHGGVAPPASPSDPGWMRWRADKLIAFHRAVYDSIKSANRNVVVSNAPSHYASGSAYPAYETFLQDWRAWLNTGKLDAAQIQMYVQPTLLQAYIPSALSGLQPEARPKAYAGIAVKPGTLTMTAAEMIGLISTVRASGLKGQSIWYYNDLVSMGYLGLIKSQVYTTRAGLPYRTGIWRDEGLILDESRASRSAGWNASPPVGGPWEGGSLWADSTGTEAIEYRFTIPASAYYEIYAYQTQPFLLTTMTARAPYDLFSSDGTVKRAWIDQSNPTNAGWTKLDDVPLQRGTDRLVVRLVNDGIGLGKRVVADAVMLVMNRRLSPEVLVSVGSDEPAPSAGAFGLLQNYPNPFNSTTMIMYQLPESGRVKIRVFDTLGRGVSTLIDEEQDGGVHALPFSAGELSSGVYLVRIEAGSLIDSRKITLLK